MKPGPEFFACNKYKEMQEHPPTTTSTMCYQLPIYHVFDEAPSYYWFCQNTETVDSAAMESAKQDCENARKLSR